MKNALFTIYVITLLLSLIGNNVFGSENLEKDTFDSSPYLKLAAAGTICIGGYCGYHVYQLWQENKNLKKHTIELQENLEFTQKNNQELINEKNTWQEQATEEKKTNFQLRQSLSNYQKELHGYKGLLHEERQEHEFTQKELNQMKRTVEDLTDFGSFSDHE